MEVKPGYKQTEVGAIPEDWDVRSIERVFSLKHGFAFSSEYFSGTGPIVLTPGNFRLEGGLYFEDRNTKRYAGNYSQEMKFLRGDLLIVMTDLTPTCNLLGKPAFVDTDEAILHNQRIGKVLLKDKSVHLPFLYYLLLSRPYLDHIREQAFGSTVRHTSNKSINSAQLAWPPPPEQQAIAAALSDADALLGELDRLIAKKCDLKQAAMQQLLTGKTRLPGFHGEWEVKRLASTCSMKSGEGITSAKIDQGSQYPCYGGNGLRGFTSRFNHEGRYALIGRQGALCGNVFGVEGQFFASEHAIVVTASGGTDIRWLTYVLRRMNLNQYSESSAQPGLSVSKISSLDISVPPTKDEQAAIAVVLSDMDDELSALEARGDKTRNLKEAMMQELLTGKTRLVTTGDAHA